MNRIFGFSPKTGLALISRYGSAAGIFSISSNEPDDILGPYSKFSGSITMQAYEDALNELTGLEMQGIRFIGITEPEYPDLLKECGDAPIGLYVRTSGKLSEIFSPRRRVAIVGTRDISPYGKEWCRRIVAGLASSPERPAIISGLALGTDITAHSAALEAGLPTIGVMATGPESIYPHRHRSIAERMAATAGCGLVTDYPPGTAPLAIHFLRRNRIIAGLSEATILVESKVKGGGMMTARLAFSYSRDVFALPGRVDDLRSQGCNHLIREKVAEPLTDIEGMLQEMGFCTTYSRRHVPVEQIAEETYAGKVTREKLTAICTILSKIKEVRGITIEEIAVSTCMPISLVISLCNLLESDGMIATDILQRCTINPRKSELFF